MTPWFLVAVVPLTALYLWVQTYFLRTSRELKRLESSTKDYAFAHIQSSLSGIAIIRTFQQEDRFEHDLEQHVDRNLRAYFASICANRWLAIRLEFIGSFTVFAAAVLAVTSVSTGNGLSGALVGLAMSYALRITQTLNSLVRMTVEVENNIIAVERILFYIQLPLEAPDSIPPNEPSVWPLQGAVSFRDYSTRYREGLDDVLKSITLDIHPREKIGVVGRTGAGKSSLTLALSRNPFSLRQTSANKKPDSGFLSPPMEVSA